MSENKRRKKIRRVEAKAWTRKYLRVASIDLLEVLLIRMGAILIKLISSPNQAETQEEEERARREPSIREGRKTKYL